MPFYDLDEVRRLASSQWISILSRLGGIRQDRLDGRHYSCPLCGGKDRFRMLDQEKGALFCNQCFSEKNGDGFAALQWLQRWTFQETVEKVAGFVGAKEVKPKKKKVRPDKDLKWSDWNDQLGKLWCLKKKPITLAGLKESGARMSQYYSLNVIAIPVWGPNGNQDEPVGWCVYNLSGGMVPQYKNRQVVGQLKCKLTYGSEPGLMGKFGSKVTWKTEGPSDMLAILSQDLPFGHGAVCNAMGAKENPINTPWVADKFSGLIVPVVHDCDQPGQEGATYVPRKDDDPRPGWAPVISQYAQECRNVSLPFDVVEDHGKDVRDYFVEGHDYDDLWRLFEKSDQVDAAEAATDEEDFEKEWPDDPFRLAKANLDNYRTTHGRAIVYWRETWFHWKDGRYVELTDDHMATRLAAFIREEFEDLWKEEIEKYKAWRNSPEYAEEMDKGPPKIRKVTSTLLRNTMIGLRTQCILGSTREMDSWLNDDDREGWFVSLKNGILDLTKLLTAKADVPREEILLPHTPDWFSTIALPYDFDEDAKCSVWRDFLEDIFNGDKAQIDCLQKWFGYLLVPDMSLHKILFVIGSPRSGKGTISRTMKALFGQQNVATPNLAELGSPFGLETMIGKRCAIVGDARIGQKVDEVAVTERLLSISGDDPQNVQRKFKSTLTAHELKVRFTLFSNMLPKLQDFSTAFLSRCIYLCTPNSYVGREDLTLGKRILEELPGILVWTIHGRFLLNEDPTIAQPSKGNVLLNEMKSMMSPVLLFLEDKCLVSANLNLQCATRRMFDEWVGWCSDNDVSNPGNIQSFGRRVKAINPIVDSVQVREGAHRYRVFLHITLKADVETRKAPGEDFS